MQSRGCGFDSRPFRSQETDSGQRSTSPSLISGIGFAAGQRAMTFCSLEERDVIWISTFFSCARGNHSRTYHNARKSTGTYPSFVTFRASHRQNNTDTAPQINCWIFGEDTVKSLLALFAWLTVTVYSALLRIAVDAPAFLLPIPPSGGSKGGGVGGRPPLSIEWMHLQTSTNFAQKCIIFA